MAFKVAHDHIKDLIRVVPTNSWKQSSAPSMTVVGSYSFDNFSSCTF